MKSMLEWKLRIFWNKKSCVPAPDWDSYKWTETPRKKKSEKQLIEWKIIVLFCKVYVYKKFQTHK